MGSGNWTISGNFDMNESAMNHNSDTVLFNGALKSILANNNAFNNLTFSGSGTTTLSDTLGVVGNAVLNSSISSGAINMSGATKTLTGGSATLSNLTISNTSSTITLTGSNMTVST